MVAALVKGLEQRLRDPENNREMIEELVNTVNSLIIPHAWVGVDSNYRIHVTYVQKDTARDQLYGASPTALRFVSDFIWEYRPWDGTITSVKSRYGKSGKTYVCNPPVGVIDSK